MIILTHKTKQVVRGDNLFNILDTALPQIVEDTVVVISSKIVAICQDRVVAMDGKTTKEELIEKEAERYIDFNDVNHGFHITIKYDQMVASAGIDESNGNGYFILWPKEIQKITNDIWRHLRKKYQLKHVGVILSDSRLTPMRWGVTGIGISHCGFKALNDFRGKPDVFGRVLKVTQIAVKDGLSAAAVVEMGESNEQTPLATITKIPFVQFQDHPPTQDELDALKITIETDVFAPFLKRAPWVEPTKEA